MNQQSHSMKGARTFLLGMLAGAGLVAGGLVLARGHQLETHGAVMIRSSAPAPVTIDGPVKQTNAELPPSVELERALVISHRLKSLVRSEPDTRFIPSAASIS